MPRSVRAALSTCTLARYEAEFADRHLLHGIVRKWATERPQQLALIDHDSGREWTYAQLDAAITAHALKLLDLGYRKGDFFATLLPLLPEHVILQYACFRIGVIHVPLDLRLKVPEIVRSLAMVEARGFAFLGQVLVGDFRKVAAAVRSQCPFIEHFLQLSPADQTMPDAIGIADWTRDAMALADAAEQGSGRGSGLAPRLTEVSAGITATDGAQVIYTTGSTGWPKPALLSHRNITAQNFCVATAFELFECQRLLINLPPSHVGCQAQQLMTAFFVGSTGVTLTMFDAERSLEAIERHRVDCIGQIPAMFTMQLRLAEFAKYDLSSLGRVVFGGQQATREFVQALGAHFPSLGTGLGLSEMAGFVTYTGNTGAIDELVGTVGYPAPITPLTIRAPMREDGSAGDELPAGDSGEICFSGPQVFLEYVNDPEAYAATVSTDGVCYTGDLGRVDARGLVFEGRRKLVIKPKGYQVHPGQIESHFTALEDQVAACGAVGAPHDVFGEGVVLFVERKPGATPTVEQLESHALGIASYMRPLHYVLLEPGTLPLNRVVKTDYVVLGQRAREAVEQLRADGGWDRQ